MRFRRYPSPRPAADCVLGTMNDFANLIHWKLQDDGGLAGVDISDLNRELNRVPGKPLGYKYSIDVLREVLR